MLLNKGLKDHREKVGWGDLAKNPIVERGTNSKRQRAEVKEKYEKSKQKNLQCLDQILSKTTR